jgi:hypothetical protein
MTIPDGDDAVPKTNTAISSDAIVDGGINDDCSITQLISSIQLTEDEENVLLQNDKWEDVEIMEQDDGVGNDVCAANGKCQMDVADSQQAKINMDQAIMLDTQMIYHRGRGNLIKELAFKVLNSGNMFAISMKHDIADVPAHLLVNYRGKYYDVFTGMDLEAGECEYDDKTVANTLKDFSLVFVKGANKKTSLANVYNRLNSKDIVKNDDDNNNNNNNNNGENILCNVGVYRKPIIINIDGQTADDEDRLFCSANGMTMAKFSFPFVYKNMYLYIRMMYDTSLDSTSNPTDILYANNVLLHDPRYDILGRGRVICVCHSDHSCGGSIGYFGRRQRCSLVNLSILEHLWWRGQDAVFRNLLRSERESMSSSSHQRQNKRRQIQWEPTQRENQEFQNQQQQQQQQQEQHPRESGKFKKTYEERPQVKKPNHYTSEDKFSNSHATFYGDNRRAKDYRTRSENTRRESYQSWHNNGNQHESTYYNESGDYNRKNTYGEPTETGNRQHKPRAMTNSDYKRSRENWSQQKLNRTYRHQVPTYNEEYAKVEPQDDQQHALLLIIRNSIQQRRFNKENYLANRVYKKRDVMKRKKRHPMAAQNLQ